MQMLTIPDKSVLPVVMAAKPVGNGKGSIMIERFRLKKEAKDITSNEILDF